ncbi:MAG TPA: hypothetical protein VMX16_07625 [Terriglobia bacterium]|nr:hypothetical protein [Terriglobia bacterium]
MGKIRKTLGISIVLILGASPCAATTIVAVHTQGQVLLASDGRITYYVGNKESTGKGCKIVKTLNCAFAARGVLLQTAAHFNLQSLGRRACQSADNLPDVVANFSRIARDPVLKGLGAVRVDEPESYRRNVWNQAAIEIVFAGYDRDHQPTAIIKRYQVNASNQVEEPPVEALAINPRIRKAIAVAYAGEYAAIKSFLAANPQWIDVTPPLQIAKELVQLEIHSHAPGVGNPIAILRVGANGLNWIDRGACRDQSGSSTNGSQ